MPDLEHAQLLLSLAERDLKDLGHMLDPAEFADETFGFHAQQSVEKALKALLCVHDVGYDYTHDLRALYRKLQEASPAELSPFRHLVALSDFAVQFRYEAYDGEPLDRKATLRDVKDLVGLVEKRISGAEPSGQSP
jgi:HEPN domain-containing protein